MARSQMAMEVCLFPRARRWLGIASIETCSISGTISSGTGSPNKRAGWKRAAFVRLALSLGGDLVQAAFNHVSETSGCGRPDGPPSLWRRPGR